MGENKSDKSNKKSSKKKPDKKKPDKARKVDKKGKSAKKASEKKKGAEPAPAPADPDTPPQKGKLTGEDAIAMAEAIVEMVNDGAKNPVAFFVSGDDALGRELIQLQGGDMEDVDRVIPVVLDAAQVRRFAMLTIADEMIWRQGAEDNEKKSVEEGGTESNEKEELGPSTG